jgi:hypothetical protein
MKLPPFLPPRDALVALVATYLARRAGLPEGTAPLAAALAEELATLVGLLAGGATPATLQGAIARAAPLDAGDLEARLLAEIDGPPTQRAIEPHAADLERGLLFDEPDGFGAPPSRRGA